MNTSAATRRVSLAAITTIALLQAAAATAAPKAGVPVLNDRAAAKVAELPATAKADSGVLGTLNPAALNAAALELALPDGRKATAQLQRVARDDRKGTQSWVGTFESSPGSLLVLSKAKGVVSGFGNYEGQTFEIQPAKNSKHVLFAVDAAKIPMQDEVSVTANDVSTTATSDYGSGAATLDAATGVVQDVLILYTSSAAATWGQATLESNIQSAVQAALQAYQTSQVNITLNVVGLQQSPVGESGSGMSTTLSNFKSNSTVKALRDKLGADMVVLVSQDSGACGQANLTVTTINGVTNTDAYAVVYSNCLSNHSLAHEIGHLQWLDHNRENTTGTRAYAYSYGFRQCVTGGFIDIMSYPCSSVSVSRIPNFSNPTVYYNGLVTGISYEADPTRASDAARSLNNTATQVANYRTGTQTITVTAPTAPSSLVARSVAYNAVSIGWTDTSSNESGFKVERSRDGVTYTEIASLGAGTVSYSDGTVAASTGYYYRVRAYNSAGNSGYSNALAATTPAAPIAVAVPAKPTSIAASNKADGSALVTWADASTNETSFEVKRETWNAKRSVWTGLTTVGTAAANVTSMVDIAGNGTYRYTVRALNSGGGSAYAGPAQVTVTGGSKSGSNARYK